MKTQKVTVVDTPAVEDAKLLKKVGLKLDENSAEHLMNTLANMYENPAEAVLREVVSNAIDSHNRANQSRPVQVHFGSVKNSADLQLTVEDFGVGMSWDNIEDIYSKYGASTKRSDNKERGGFGLGSKSAFAIADNFSLISRKNGEEIEVLLSRNAHGGGDVNLIRQEKTSKSNGVKVTIPLTSKTLTTISSSYLKVLKGFNPQELYVNGAPLAKSIYDLEKFLPVHDGEEIIGWIEQREPEHFTSKLFIPMERQSVTKNVNIIIGGVSYPMLDAYEVKKTTPYNLNVEKSFLDKSPKIRLAYATTFTQQHRIYLNLPVGSVDLPASRDKLQDTAQNRETIQAVFENFLDQLPVALQQKFDSISDRAEAVNFYVANFALWQTVATHGRIYNSSPFTEQAPTLPVWRGEPFPKEVPFKGLALVSKMGETMPKAEETPELKTIKYVDSLYPFVKTRYAGPNSASYTTEPTGALSPVGKNGYKMMQRTIVVAPAGQLRLAEKKVRQQMRSFCKSQKAGQWNRFVWVTESPVTNPWLTATHNVISLDDFTKTVKDYLKEEASKRIKKPKIEAKYSLILPDSGMLVRIPVSEILDKTKQYDSLLYATAVDLSGSKIATKFWYEIVNRKIEKNKISEYLPFFSVVGDKLPFVVLESERSETVFKKNFPDAVNIVERIQNQLKESAEKEPELLQLGGFLSQIESQDKYYSSGSRWLLSHLATVKPHQFSNTLLKNASFACLYPDNNAKAWELAAKNIALPDYIKNKGNKVFSPQQKKEYSDLLKVLNLFSYPFKMKEFDIHEEQNNKIVEEKVEYNRKTLFYFGSASKAEAAAEEDVWSESIVKAVNLLAA